MLILTAFVVGSAHAAEVTDFPPAQRADIRVGYDYRHQFGSLEETWGGRQWGYGRRTETQHDLSPRIEFAIIQGVAINVTPDATLSRVYAFPSEGDIFCPQGYGCDGPSRMMYDPVNQTGSYANGGVAVKLAPEDIPRYAGKGLNGVWVGLAVQPFAERYSRNHLVTWRLDAAIRSANRHNSFWTAREDGTRGAAPGGAGFKLAAAFSTTNDTANPYLSAVYQREGKFVLDAYRDNDGTVWWTGQTLNPSDHFDVRGGVELVAAENKTTESRFAVDMYFGFGYRSWEDIPSGILLPSVLDASRSIVVTHYDHIIATGGLGLDTHFNKYAGFRLAFDASYLTPHPLEHVYPVRTDYDTVELGVHGSLDIKIR